MNTHSRRKVWLFCLKISNKIIHIEQRKKEKSEPW